MSMVDQTSIALYFAEQLGIQPGISAPAAQVQCARCEDSKWTLDSQGELIRCPDCTCPTCSDLGLIRIDVPYGSPGFGQVFPCPDPTCPVRRAELREREEKLFRVSQLPAEYQDLSLETFMALPDAQREGKMQAAWGAHYFIAGCERGCWVNRASIAAQFDDEVDDDIRNWLVFYGGYGVGKTGLAAAIVQGVIARGQPIRYTRLQDFIKAVKDRYDDKWRQDDLQDEYGDSPSGKVIDLVRQSPILVIDEFDFPQITPHVLGIVENLINYRHNNHLATVITTNLDEAAFERRWERLITSRIKQRAHWLPVGGVVLRKTTAAFNWE